MNDEQMKHLIELSDRANNRMGSHGAEEVVIYRAELDALEDAIEELQLKRTVEAAGEGFLG